MDSLVIWFDGKTDTHMDDRGDYAPVGEIDHDTHELAAVGLEGADADPEGLGV